MALKKSELYSSLWQSCDELRGGMDASQYKDYVLVLLFIKYVSDKYAGQPYAPITIPKSWLVRIRAVGAAVVRVPRPAGRPRDGKRPQATTSGSDPGSVRYLSRQTTMESIIDHNELDAALRRCGSRPTTLPPSRISRIF